MDQLKAIAKRILSYGKSDWDLTDYPIRIRQQKPADEDMEGRLKLIPWSVQIINWWQMGGSGETKDEALANLRTCFDNYRSSHDYIPRPGTGAPLEFASSEHLGKYEDIAEEFFERILDLDYSECFITDESSLWHFHAGDDNIEYEKKIKSAYGVDVSDIESGVLVEIFQRISEKSTHNKGVERTG